MKRPGALTLALMGSMGGDGGGMMGGSPHQQATPEKTP